MAARRGSSARRDLYNLYHVLNHLNLFGGGYGAQAERMIGRLLAGSAELGRQGQKSGRSRAGDPCPGVREPR